MEVGDFLPSQAVVERVKKELEAHNTERAALARELKDRARLYMGLAVAATVACVVVFALLFPSRPFLSQPYIVIVTLGAVAFVFGWVKAIGPADKFQQDLRERLFPVIFGYVEDFRYRHRQRPQSFERLPVAATGSHNLQSFDDMFSGTYGGFPFEFYEAHLSRKRNNFGKSGNKPNHTVFLGVVFAFRSPVPFGGVLVAHRTSSAFARFFRDLFGGDIQPVKTGDPSIDDTHEFRTNNPPAAHALINDDLVKALDLLYEAWPDQPARIALSYEDGYVLIPIAKNLFELPPIKVPLVYETHVEPMIADFAKVFAAAALMRASLERRAEAG